MNQTSTFSVSVIDGSNLFISGYPSNAYSSNNGCQLLNPLGITRNLSKITAVNLNNVWLGTWDGKIFHSSNGGNAWDVQFNDSTKTTFVNYVKMFDLNNGIAMADGLSDTSPAVFLKTTDGGAHWNSMNDSSFGAYSYDQWRLVQFVTPNTGYFFSAYASPTILMKTTNGGMNWKPTNYPTGWGASVIRFYNEQIGLVQRTIKNSMYRTLDGGVTWELFASPSTLKGEDIEFAPGNPAKVWYSDWNKIYTSNDTGRTWKEQAPCRVRDIEFISESIGFAVGDSGVFATTNGGEKITVIESSTKGNIPLGFYLYQNYPNPFNPTTTIVYNISEESNVRAIVTDLLGREIETLVDGLVFVGTHSIQWNAERYAGGMYFVRMSAGDQSRIRKVMLLK